MTTHHDKGWEEWIDEWFGEGAEGDLTRGRFSIKEVKLFISTEIERAKREVDEKLNFEHAIDKVRLINSYDKVKEEAFWHGKIREEMFWKGYEQGARVQIDKKYLDEEQIKNMYPINPKE